MRQYQASHDDAIEATHEAWLNIQGREYNEKARIHYWFISAKNEYLDMVNTKTVPIEEHHIPTNEQPSIEDKFQSRKLDRLVHKLESDEWTLLEMIRYGFPNKIIGEAFKWERSTVRTRKSELMKKIKLLVVMILIAFVTIPAMAQVNITRTAGTGYFLQTAQGDTLQLRGSTPFYASYHVAYQDAINHSAETNMEIHVRANFVDRVRAEYFYDSVYETIYDTLIVTQIDTVFISETIIDSVFVNEIVKHYDNAYNFSDIAWHDNVKDFHIEVRQSIGDSLGIYRIAVDGVTNSSSIRVATNCYGWNGLDRTQIINERTSGRAEIEEGFARWESNELMCRGIMTYWITDSEGNLSVWFADIGQILVLD